MGDFNAVEGPIGDKKFDIHYNKLSGVTNDEITFLNKLIDNGYNNVFRRFYKDKIQYIIRLSGIDAPEKKQAFGNKAKQSLSELVFDKDVQITWFKKDRYGRTIGKVEIDNMDICLEQIKRGLAWHYKHYERDQTKEDKLRYSNAENDAKTNNLGLWMNENPIRHSDFRRGN